MPLLDKFCLVRYHETKEGFLNIGGNPVKIFDYTTRTAASSCIQSEVLEKDPKDPLALRITHSNLVAVSSNLGSAILRFAQNNAAVGKTAAGNYVAEIRDDNGETQFCVYNPKKGSFKAGVLTDDGEMTKYKIADIDNFNRQTYDPNKPRDGHSNTVLLISVLPALMHEEEFSDAWKKLMNILQSNKDADFYTKQETQDELNSLLGLLSDNAELRLDRQNLSTSVPNNARECVDASFQLPLLKISDLKGRYAPIEASIGEFKVLTCRSEGQEVEADKSDIWDKYSLGNNYSMDLLPVIDKNTVVVPEYVETVCKHVKMSKKFRNFGFRGEAGSGKSLSAKIIAAMLHMPHYIFTCSANTEICDFQGQIIPTLTGDRIGYTYAESPLLKAVRDGGVLEIQEPNVIVQPGVIVGLNGIMEPNGVLILPTGERIQRHPDTVIVITTNVSYEGCRDMNVSLLDRLDLVFDVNNPSTEELAERCRLQTGFENIAMLNEMAQIVTEVSEQMKAQGIEDGTAGLRSLINWAESTKITGDPYESGVNCLISKTSASKEDRDLLLKRLNAASFAKRTRTKRI